MHVQFLIEVMIIPTGLCPLAALRLASAQISALTDHFAERKGSGLLR